MKLFAAPSFTSYTFFYITFRVILAYPCRHCFVTENIIYIQLCICIMYVYMYVHIIIIYLNTELEYILFHYTTNCLAKLSILTNKSYRYVQGNLL